MGEVVRLLNEESLVNKFLEQFKSEDSIRSYKSVIKGFFGIDAEFVSDYKVRGIKYDDVNKYVEWMFKNGKSDNTIKKHISCMSSLYEFVGEDNPWKDRRIKQYVGNRLQKGDIGKGVALNKVEIKELMDKIDKKRDKVMIGFMLRSGLRACEVVKVKWEDFIYKNDKWHVRVVGKRNKVRIINLGENEVEEIRKYVEDMGIRENERIFEMTVRNVNYVIDRYSDVISAHDCRRTYTTNLLKDGVPLVKVQKALGHSNARTTERYLIDNDVYDGDVGDFVTW